MSTLVSKITLFLHMWHHSKIQKYESPILIIYLNYVRNKYKGCFNHFLDPNNAKSYLQSMKSSAILTNRCHRTNQK